MVEREVDLHTHLPSLKRFRRSLKWVQHRRSQYHITRSSLYPWGGPRELEGRWNPHSRRGRAEDPPTVGSCADLRACLLFWRVSPNIINKGRDGRARGHRARGRSRGVWVCQDRAGVGAASRSTHEGQLSPKGRAGVGRSSVPSLFPTGPSGFSLHFRSCGSQSCFKEGWRLWEVV